MSGIVDAESLAVEGALDESSLVDVSFKSDDQVSLELGLCQAIEVGSPKRNKAKPSQPKKPFSKGSAQGNPDPVSDLGISLDNAWIVSSVDLQINKPQKLSKQENGKWKRTSPVPIREENWDILEITVGENRKELASDDSNPGKKVPVSKKISSQHVYEEQTGGWSELPPLAGFSDRLPMFCHRAALGLNLVVIGGWNPVTWEVSNAVFIYNFLSAKWHRGTDMPGGQRSFYACASNSDRTVFIAGGHDYNKNALRFVMMYDVTIDEWVQLPDMARERDE
ncbi:unnamed protein product [Ilex paraguariensis]|uniref:Uncharacterized protein n=1 Tax=Ilex paraguariensis TaxID=185542 RepID=A0ABC8RC25_9AQUA